MIGGASEQPDFELSDLMAHNRPLSMKRCVLPLQRSVPWREYCVTLRPR
jgi:hypothetical protein